MTTHAARARAHAVLDMLRATYPATFMPFDAVPLLLAIGIREAIQARHPDIPFADLRRAFGLYCCRVAYRRASVVGAERIDLTGGVVSVLAEEEIARIKAVRKADKAARKAARFAAAQEAKTASAAPAQSEPQVAPKPAPEPPPIVEPIRPKLSLPRRQEARRPVVVEVVKRRRIAGPMR